MKRVFVIVFICMMLFKQNAYATPSNWASSSIEYAVKHGLVTNKLLNKFQDPINREEFAELIILLYEAIAGESAPVVYYNPFVDTSSVQVIQAHQLGILSGKGNGLYTPFDLITRQEIAVMLLRTIMVSNYEISYSNKSNWFSDEYLISAWAKEAVHTLNEISIITGVGSNRINPLGNTSREQAITLLAKIHQYCENKSLTYDINLQQGPELLTSIEIGKFSQSVVKIYVENQMGEIYTGSAFFYEPGKIATNYHVVENSQRIEIEYDDGSLYSGNVTIIGLSQEHDLVAILIDDYSTPALKLGDSDYIKRGQNIYTIGSPMGLANSLGSGLISSIRYQSIQISAPISPGSSGGVLMDEYGDVVGITNSGIIEGENLGFAVPINLFKEMDKSMMLALSEIFKPSDTHNTNQTLILRESVYFGSTKNGLPHGFGTMTFNDGDIYEGEWIEGRFEGEGIIKFAGGDRYEGQLLDWVFNGNGTYYYLDGDLYYGEWSKGVQKGFGTYLWIEGDSYVGEWEGGMFHGNGIYTFEDGESLNGLWKNGEYVK